MWVMLSYAPPHVSILGLLSYCALELVPVPFIKEVYMDITLQPGSEEYYGRLSYSTVSTMRTWYLVRFCRPHINLINGI